MEKLPIKTKIAAWWMIIEGIIGILGVLFIIGFTFYFCCFFWKNISFSEFVEYFFEAFSPKMIYLLIIPLSLSMLFILSGVFLLKKKKESLGLSIIVIFLGMIASLFAPEKDFSIIFENILLSLIPLILLLLDRKNFFKVAK